jgi:hypothetical protein
MGIAREVKKSSLVDHIEELQTNKAVKQQMSR